MLVCGAEGNIGLFHWLKQRAIGIIAFVNESLNTHFRQWALSVRNSAMILHLLFLAFLTIVSSHAELKDKPGPSPLPGAAKPYEWDYEFGRPIKPGEMTYNDYRRQHADGAAKLLKLKASEVGDGMDTWHWWVGVDNPGFWQDLTALTSNKHNYTDFRIDFIRLLATL